MRSLAIWCALAGALAASAPVVAIAAGDARAGEALYVGATRPVHGGAPCLGCHALAAHGLAWSASFGPDLSAASASYDREALEAVLGDPPFPSMEPIYRGHALTPGERADLAAFLLGPQVAPPAGDVRARLALEAGAIALLFLGVLVLLARRRMPAVKDALARARSGGPR